MKISQITEGLTDLEETYDGDEFYETLTAPTVEKYQEMLNINANSLIEVKK